jgi:hypothetical protein
MDLLCKYNRLMDVLDEVRINDYLHWISSPDDLQFDLTKGIVYQAVSISVLSDGTSWVYVFLEQEDLPFDMTSFPAILFDFSWKNIPANWGLTMSGHKGVEILPKWLADIGKWKEGYSWDELYYDGDPEMMAVLLKELGQRPEDRALRKLIRLNELIGFNQFDEVVSIQAIDESIPVGSKGIVLAINETTPKTYTVEFFKDQSVSLGSFIVQPQFLLLDQ